MFQGDQTDAKDLGHQGASPRVLDSLHSGRSELGFTIDVFGTVSGDGAGQAGRGCRLARAPRPDP
jgi:hypothetical protein